MWWRLTGVDGEDNGIGRGGIGRVEMDVEERGREVKESEEWSGG